MKPIRKTSKVIDKYETFTTAGDLADLLHVSWCSMKLIDDADEVLIEGDLPAMIPVVVKIRKRKEGRVKFRIMNGET